VVPTSIWMWSLASEPRLAEIVAMVAENRESLDRMCGCLCEGTEPWAGIDCQKEGRNSERRPATLYRLD